MRPPDMTTPSTVKDRAPAVEQAAGTDEVQQSRPGDLAGRVAPDAGVTSLYVVGGQQHSLRPLHAGTQPWYRYRNGIVLEVQPSTRSVRRMFEYVSPQSVVPQEGAVALFKSGTLVDDVLYLCTPTEVMSYQVPSFERLRYLSLPQFNDVHHVRPTPAGSLLVANTGLDMVIDVTWEGEVLREWDVLGGKPWERFSRSIDYRTVASTKPHRSHPNFVFYIGSDVWVTRFEQKDAVCLTTPGRRIDIGLERVHDGVPHGNHVYFTTVDGKLVIVEQGSWKVERVWDLRRSRGSGDLTGWCRGLLIDGEKIWIGFSRLRPTKFRENVSWIASGFRRFLPTHIACYDLATGQCHEVIDLEPHGLNAVFSLHAVRG